MLSKKKLVICGLSLLAMVPLAAQADGSLFQTKVIAYDYHYGSSKTSVYRSDARDTMQGLENFLSSNSCLALAADGAKNAIISVEQTPQYTQALTGYRAKCGSASSSDPIFVVSASLATGVINNAGQPASSANVYLTVIDGKQVKVLPISKKNGKSNSVSYVANANDTSCSTVGSMISDVNTGAIQNQLVGVLVARATTCTGNANAANARQDLLQQNGNAIDDLLGRGTGTQGSNAGTPEGVVNAGAWNTPGGSHAGQPNQ